MGCVLLHHYGSVIQTRIHCRCAAVRMVLPCSGVEMMLQPCSDVVVAGQRIVVRAHAGTAAVRCDGVRCTRGCECGQGHVAQVMADLRVLLS